jgi:hypothetical protein
VCLGHDDNNSNHDMPCWLIGSVARVMAAISLDPNCHDSHDPPNHDATLELLVAVNVLGMVYVAHVVAVAENDSVLFTIYHLTMTRMTTTTTKAKTRVCGMRRHFPWDGSVGATSVTAAMTMSSLTCVFRR